MAREIKIEYTKTYATRANAIRAVHKIVDGSYDGLEYSINPVEVDGGIRYGVLFYGERAIQAGMHFHFNIAG